MTVYIEYVILDNFVITYLIGWLSFRALKVSFSFLRNLTSAFVGTFVAVCLPLLSLSSIALIMTRIALLILLTIILFHKKSKLLISSLVFLGITFLFGGTLFAIGYIVHGNITAALTLSITDLPISLLILFSILIAFLAKKVFLSLTKAIGANQNIYEVEFWVKEKSYRVKGFCDSGNHIFDSKSGLPVAVLDFSTTQKILTSEELIRLLSGEGEGSLKEARQISYTPFGSKKQHLWVIEPQKFLLYLDKDEHINMDIMLGLSIHSFADSSDYSIILNPSMLRIYTKKQVNQ